MTTTQLAQDMSQNKPTWGVLVAKNQPTPENGIWELIESNERELEGKKLAFFLQNEKILFGRRPGNDVIITGNPCLSGTHCGFIIRTSLTSQTSSHIIIFIDYSSNSCYVNGKQIGKGHTIKLHSGDIIDLVNAGPNKHTRHNLTFNFFRIEDYIQQEDQYSHILPLIKEKYTSPISFKRKRSLVTLLSKDEEEKKNSKSILNKNSYLSAWALARRMHRHEAEEFYIIEKKNPLGEGAFSVVYPASLRLNQAVSIEKNILNNESFTVILKEPHQEWEDDVKLEFLEQQPCSEVIEATQLALDHMVRRKSNKSNSTSFESSDIIYNFAVKVIEKKRMLFPAEARQHYYSGNVDKSLLLLLSSNNKKEENYFKESLEINSSTQEQKVLKQLVALETQTQEHETERAQVLLIKQISSKETLNFGQVSSYEKEERLWQREKLLTKLNPSMRLRYEKELQQKTRHRREIDILLAVNHPSITKLYEVFDGEKRLELVMEQATGGEVFRLIHENGPLPEFVVKVIIFQVLEAVLYLHHTGITHRDLKLENLLLRKPFEIGPFCEFQRAILLEKLTRYLVELEKESLIDEKQEEGKGGKLLNPFSPIYTVHVGRSLWPEVQVSDFGLSRMLEVKSDVDDDNNNNNNNNNNIYNSLIYTRNDMLTVCGTRIYVAPEVVIPSLRPNQVGYSAAVDIFSIGVIAFALLTGRAPFSPKNDDSGKSHSNSLNYFAPLNWERIRSQKKSNGKPFYPTKILQLPLFMQQETLNLPMDPIPHNVKHENGEHFIKTYHQEQEKKSRSVYLHTIHKAIEVLKKAPKTSILHECFSTHHDISPTELPPISQFAQEFITSLLDCNARCRPTADEAIQHPWLQDCKQ